VRRSVDFLVVQSDVLGLAGKFAAVTAKVGDFAGPEADGRSQAAEGKRSPEGRAASRGQDQVDADPPKHSRLLTVARWAVNISIVCLLAATMVVWLIFLAWAGRHLLALL